MGCSALALTEGDDVVLGAVYHPHKDQLYVGGPDLPSTRNGEPTGTLQDRELVVSCVSTDLHPPFNDDAVDAAFSRTGRCAATLRMLGSAIVRGVGGATRRTTTAGVEWSVSGAPTAVAEVCAALESE